MDGTVIEQPAEETLLTEQAKIIAELWQETTDLKLEIAAIRAERNAIASDLALEHNCGPARFYRQLQDAVKTDPNLQQEWKRFVAMLILFLEDREPGLTSSLYD